MILCHRYVKKINQKFVLLKVVSDNVLKLRTTNENVRNMNNNTVHMITIIGYTHESPLVLISLLLVVWLCSMYTFEGLCLFQILYKWSNPKQIFSSCLTNRNHISCYSWWMHRSTLLFYINKRIPWDNNIRWRCLPNTKRKTTVLINM